MMRRLITAIAAAAMVPLAGLAAMPRVHVLTFSPAHDRLRILRSSASRGEPFEALVKATHPDIAVNGTFYGTDGRPLGLLRSNGKWVNRGGHMRTVFAVDARGRASVTSRDAIRRHPASYPFALAAGPRLLTDGRVTLNPEAEGFRSAARRVRASRVALCVRRDGAGLVVVDEHPVTLAEFAAVCRKAGAVDAVNLDGGSATALYHKGQTKVSPRGPMVNVLAITKR